MPRVVVVGAGLSGLVCARQLVRAGIDALVFEARDRVGGRTLTRGGLDLGAMWMSAGQDRLRGLAAELGVRTAPQHRDGAVVVARPEGLRSVLGGLERWRRFRELERLSRAATAVGGERSLADWLDQRVKRADARAMIELAAELETAASPAKVSLLHYLTALRASGGFKPGREVRFEGGAQQLSTRIAEELAGRVRLSCPVVAIDQSDSGVTVAVEGATVSADYGVLAVPPSLCASIDVRGRSPARAVVERAMPLANVVKLIAVYPAPFWRDQGLSGEAYSIGSRLRATADYCSADGGRAALVGFIVGDATAEAGDPIADLVDLFGDQAAAPIDYVEHDWSTDPWAGGCIGNALPGSDFDAEALRAPCGRVHYAGSETAREWPRYLEGAICAGQRVAGEIIDRLGAR